MILTSLTIKKISDKQWRGIQIVLILILSTVTERDGPIQILSELQEIDFGARN